MGNTKKLNIKNRTYYFCDDLLNIKYLDPKLLKLDKKSFNYISMDMLDMFILDMLQKNLNTILIA